MRTAKQFTSVVVDLNKNANLCSNEFSSFIQILMFIEYKL